MTKDGKPMPPAAKKGAAKEKAKAQANVKSILTKMVPYSSFPYADHVLRELDVDPNAVCTFDHIDKLIEAAINLKQLVLDMENVEDIPGFTIYTKEEQKKQEDDEECDTPNKVTDIATSEMLEKFKDKTVKEFMPMFVLAQHKHEENLEYFDFDECVDEYFSQAEKQRHKQRVEQKENSIQDRVTRI